MIRPRRSDGWPLLLAALLFGCGGLDSPDPARRADAVRALSSERGDRPVPALIVAQRDPSALVRLAAAEAIALRKGPHAPDALGAMLSDPDPRVADAAARGLARLGDLAGARAALTEGYALASPDARRSIAAALDEIGVALRDAVEAEARRLWARNLGVLSGGSSPAARAGAAEELGASGRNEAVARLLQLVARPDEDPLVVEAALRGLGEAGDLTARPALEKAMEGADQRVARAAAHALGELGDPEATPPLARLASAGSGPLHLAAFDALEALPMAPEVSQAFCGIALRTGSPALAARAARAAWTRNADCPASAFAARAGRGDAAALAAIAELHPEPAVADPLIAKLGATLMDARGSSERRALAARVLGQLKGTAATAVADGRARALYARLAALRARWLPRGIAGGLPLPPDEGVRLGILLARPATAPNTTAGAAEAREWIDTAPSAEAEELSALLATLGTLHDVAARDLLGTAATDPSPTIRAGAIEGLGRLGGGAPPAELATALSDPAERVRLAAIGALARFGPAAVAALEQGMDRALAGDERFAASLSRALGETGAPSALKPLERLLSGPAPGSAAISIAALGAAEGADPLVAHLNRKGAPGRVEALEALAQLASRTAGPAFAAELLSDRWEVRVAAARAIGRLRYEPASAHLEALRVDYDGRVRRAAMEALAKLPSIRPGAR